MKVETIDKNKVKLTFEVSAEKFEKGMDYSYKKNRGRISLAGFRKGKVPRKLIEAEYGKEIFFEDAINFVLPEAYDEAINSEDINAVSKPEIDVEDVTVENGVVFTAEVYIKPEVTVGEFKGLTYIKADTSCSDEELEAEINSVRDKNSRIITVTDRNVMDNDIVKISYKGLLDGEPFEGGTNDDYDLIIGSHTFIDTFEEQIIGHSIGETMDVNVTFPADYHSEDLKGKSVKFIVEIKGIKFKELPEINDDLAQDVSEFDTLEEYKNDIKNKIEERKVGEAESDKEAQVMKNLVKVSTMDVPEIMFEERIDDFVEELSHRLKHQGMTLELYLQFIGQTMDQLREMYKPVAEDLVKGRLALEEVAKTQNISIAPAQIDEELIAMTKNTKLSVEQIKQRLGERRVTSIVQDLIVRETLKLVISSAVAVSEEEASKEAEKDAEANTSSGVKKSTKEAEKNKTKETTSKKDE